MNAGYKIDPTPNYSDVLKIETSDKVLGGDLGAINLQAQQLANRDAYLSQAVLDTYKYVMKFTNAPVTLPGGVFISGADVWTELDLSAIVGVNRAIVFLRVYCGGSAVRISFKPANENKNMNAYLYNATGYSSGYADADEIITPACITDETGRIKYCANAAGSSNTIHVVAFQVLQVV